MQDLNIEIAYKKLKKLKYEVGIRTQSVAKKEMDRTEKTAFSQNCAI